MGYPRKYLNAGEEVVVDIRPHWKYLFSPVILLLVIIGAAIADASSSLPQWLTWATLAALALSLLWLLSRYIRWATTRLVVTNSRIVDRRGVLARKGREIPLTALSDIGYHQSFFERMIGCGDVLMESAGRDGQEIFSDLPRPAQIHNAIYRQMELVRAAPPVWAAANRSPSIPDQIDQLDGLRRRGVITDAEFEAKKAELLGRL